MVSITILGILSISTILALIMVVSFVEMKKWLRIVVIIVGMLVLLIEALLLCVMDNDKETEENFRLAVESREQNNAVTANEGEFYKGTLRSGQVLESNTSIVILGDVNPGARIISGGNVVVLGSLKGTVYAGANGIPGAFVVALEMNPVQVRIGDVIARCGDSNKKRFSKPETKIAYVDGENIYIEPLGREVLSDIKF